MLSAILAKSTLLEVISRPIQVHIFSLMLKALSQLLLFLSVIDTSDIWTCLHHLLELHTAILLSTSANLNLELIMDGTHMSITNAIHLSSKLEIFNIQIRPQSRMFSNYLSDLHKRNGFDHNFQKKILKNLKVFELSFANSRSIRTLFSMIFIRMILKSWSDSSISLLILKIYSSIISTMSASSIVSSISSGCSLNSKFELAKPRK